MNSSRADSRTGSQLPRSSATTFRELPGDVEVVGHPDLTPVLESEMVRTWVEVTNRGGAGIGFLPPVRAEDIRPTAAELFKRVRSAGAHLVVVRREDELIGWLAIVLNRDHTQSHWAWLKRMHVLPEAQGTGIGAAMLDAAVDICRSVGLSQLYLTTDGQSGPVDFYANKGFVEVGRMPRNTLAADGSLHDEVYMVREFTSGDE